MKLYADDTKIYRELRNTTSNIQMLQSDLDSIGHRANTWQLRFNEEKCEAMRITHSRDNLSTDYTLGTTLKDVKSFKDLGVEISKDLSSSQHISTIVNKANQVLGLIRRTVGTVNTSTFSLLYNSLVRPLLRPVYTGAFCRGNSMQFLSCQNCIKFQTCSKPLRYGGDKSQWKSHLIYTCDFEVVTLSATKIASSCCDKNRLCKRAFRVRCTSLESLPR